MFGLQHHGASLSGRGLGAARAPDVEAHVLEVILSDAQLPVKVMSLETLSELRPLHPSTVDALLDFYEAHLQHIGVLRTSDACAADCMVSDVRCRVLPLTRCKADCDRTCVWSAKLSLALSQLLQDRLVSEARKLDRVREGGTPRSLTADPVLRAASDRLAHAASEHVRLFGTAAYPHEHTISPARFKAGRMLMLSSSGPSGRARVLQGSVSSATGRRLSFRTSSGAAPTELASRARRLGALTLLDLNLGYVRCPQPTITLVPRSPCPRGLYQSRPSLAHLNPFPFVFL